MDARLPQVVEQVLGGNKTPSRDRTLQVVNTRVQHVVPLLQFTDKVVDIPVVAKRQIRVNRNVQKTMEISQLQYTDDAVNVPVVLVVLVPQVQVVAQTAEIPQLQVVGKIGEIPEDFSRENPERDSAAEQDFACRQQDACEESSRDACRDWVR